MDEIANIIRDRAAAYGVPADILLQFGRVESGLDPNAQSKSSSAGGLFQFVDKTWNAYGGGDKFDPRTNADAGARLLRDNLAALRSSGLEPSAANAYLAHFAGAPSATRLLTSEDATPVSEVLSPAAIQANPFLGRMTVGDLRAWAERKIAGGPANFAKAAPGNMTGPMPPGGADLSGMLSLASAQAQQSEPEGPSLPQVLRGFLTAPDSSAPPAPAPPPIPMPQRRQIAAINPQLLRSQLLSLR